MLRVHGQSNEVDYLVMAVDPGRRRRFRLAEQAIDYLMQLERGEPEPESAAAAEAPGKTRRPAAEGGLNPSER